LSKEASELEVKILLVDDDPDEYRLIKRLVNQIEGIIVKLEYVDGIVSALNHLESNTMDIVLLDNRLVPNNDFRETAPQLRKAGYVGPIGVISSDLNGSYFQEFPEYGVDFRIGKDEIDAAAITFIITEYTQSKPPDECSEDLG
jgi:CheY-like chemotaxis protein